MSRGGRGRGRGRGNVTFNMESIGFGRGDALPPPTLQPPPKYPALRQPPLPLLGGDDVNYMLALHKQFLQTRKSSPYFIQAEETKSDVERYSDKYRATRNTDNTIAWKPDWSRLPRELKIAVRKKRKASAATVAPNLAKARMKNTDDSEIKKKLEVLEKQDGKEEEAKSDKEGEDSDAGEEVVVEEDEEENEEENDYLSSYFDNGETYLDEEEDNLDDKDGGIY